MFRNCIVRKPCKALVDGITSGLYPGKPDYELACKQHEHYIECLKQCGVQVEVLPPLEEYPDSVFVEDPAVVTRSCAIIANPGAASRNGEKNEILPAIKKFYPEDRIHFITGEGHLDGGDVMMVGDHFYVGRSARTNEEGIRQFSEILAKYGMTCSEVTLEKVLHLKTGVNYIENNNMLVSGEFVTKPEFEKYNKILIPEGEEYAANCIWMNGNVIVPEGYPGVAKLVKRMHYVSFVGMFRSDLFEGLCVGHAPKKCKICGKWFLTTNARHTKYCGGYAPGDKLHRTCRQIGNLKGREQRELADDHPIIQIYEKRLNTINRYVKRGTLDADLAEVMKKLAKDKELRAKSDVAYAKGAYEKEMEQAALLAEAKIHI